MNWDHIEANWDQFKIIIQQQWGKLTDTQITEITGKREKLISLIQETYNAPRSEAELQVDVWLKQQDEEAFLIERATERNGISG
jgi:uncharacterized protein YjbJ (UPF0337 family)